LRQFREIFRRLERTNICAIIKFFLINSSTQNHMKTKNEAGGPKCAVCNHVHTKPDGTCSCDCEVGKKESLEV